MGGVEICPDDGDIGPDDEIGDDEMGDDEMGDDEMGDDETCDDDEVGAAAVAGPAGAATAGAAAWAISASAPGCPGSCCNTAAAWRIASALAPSSASRPARCMRRMTSSGAASTAARRLSSSSPLTRASSPASRCRLSRPRRRHPRAVVQHQSHVGPRVDPRVGPASVPCRSRVGLASIPASVPRPVGRPRIRSPSLVIMHARTVAAPALGDHAMVPTLSRVSGQDCMITGDSRRQDCLTTAKGCWPNRRDSGRLPGWRRGAPGDQ